MNTYKVRVILMQIRAGIRKAAALYNRVMVRLRQEIQPIYPPEQPGLEVQVSHWME